VNFYQPNDTRGTAAATKTSEKEIKEEEEKLPVTKEKGMGVK